MWPSPLGKQLKGWTNIAKDIGIVNKVWKSVPWGIIPIAVVYRTDWAKEVGYDKFPDTYDEMLVLCRKMKEKGHYSGFALGRSIGDANQSHYPMLWAHGGAECTKDSKRVAINSPGTAKAVDYVRKLFKEAEIEDVFSWDDSSNNRAFLAGELACTGNAASIYWAETKNAPQLRAVTNHALWPKGPAGRFGYSSALGLGIFKFSKFQKEAKAFITWLIQPKQYSAWIGVGEGQIAGLLNFYEDDPVWKKDPKLEVIREIPEVRADARVPWAADPARGRGDGQIRAREHVRPSLQGHVHAGYDQAGRGGAEGDLRQSVGSTPGRRGEWPPSRTQNDCRHDPWVSRFLKPEALTGYFLISPAVFLMLVLLAYPFVLAVWISMTDRVLGEPGKFIWFQNFFKLLQDPLFRETVWNSFIYTITTVFFKMFLGVILALLLNQEIPCRNLIRGAILLPWIVPTSLSVLTWLWMFDSLFSIVNYILLGLGLISRKVPWLGDPFWAMVSVIIVNTWRGLPFFAISFLAGLMTIPRELYEAAEVDGALRFRQFWHITLPLLQPIIAVVVLFSTIWTFADFQIVYILTHGGPINATQIFATMAYDVALVAGRIGEGSAISLFLFPALLVVIILMLRYLRRD